MAKHRPAANWDKLSEALWKRSGGFCEVSGRPLHFETFDRHHRRPRGMGGTSQPMTDSLPNLIALDPEVHNGAPWSVHQKPSWSRPRGYLLPKSFSDEQMLEAPMLYHGKIWVVLGQDGDIGNELDRATRALWQSIAEPTMQPVRPRGSQYR
jgi:hypothetical protein